MLKYSYDEIIQLGTDYNNLNEVLRYDEKMKKIRNIDKEIHEIKDSIQLKTNDIIMEIGCGTSNLSIGLSKYCKEVYALDISKIMLEFSEKKTKKLNIKNIKYFNSGFLTYSFQDIKFDSIITQLALHHLPDFWKFIALKRISDNLKHGGFFLLTDVIYSSKVNNFDNYFDKIIENIEDDYTKKDVKIHILKEYSTFDWIIENMLVMSGLNIINIKNDEPFLISYLCQKN